MIGKSIGHYRVLEKLGGGGMGEVWLAEDTSLERKVVLKFLSQHLLDTESVKARFLQEAKAVARLNHPNIAMVYEFGEVEERPFIVMEYIEGGSLRGRLDETEGEPLPIPDIVGWMIQTAEGLAEAHSKGIIHRDIKPDNLMLGPKGRLKITDFGLARIKSSPRLTESGATVGTAAYTSPEQIKGIDVDHRLDYYSLGVTLYELLTGVRPFESDDLHTTYYAIVSNHPDPPSSLRADISPKLNEITLRLLQKDPAVRYQSAEEIVSDLKDLLEAGKPVSSAEPALEPPREVRRRIVIADDDEDVRQSIADLLSQAGWDVQQAADGQVAIDLVRERVPLAVLLDLEMPVKGGQETLEELKAFIPELPVVILTGRGDIDRAVSTMKAGAFDFLTKPPDSDHLLLVLNRSVENRMRDIELAELRLLHQSLFTLVGGKAPAMRAFLDNLERVTATDSTVLLIGETGSGKELAARTIWSRGGRAAAPFIAVNCAALPNEHLELDLFGYETETPDVTTDARRGRVEEADGGTLFLDKVGELPPSVQAQLVEVLEVGEFRRVGGTAARSTNLRLIAANTTDLHDEVAQGWFRDDLYHHLSVVVLEVPPLRERWEDLPDIVDNYLEQLCSELGKPMPELSEEVWDRLRTYDWPGNNRELRNTLERALVLSPEGSISPEAIPDSREAGRIGFADADFA